MSKKFTVLTLDPPYYFGDKLTHSDVKRGADANYNTMSIESLKKLKIKDLADPEGAVLCLWVPSSLLQDGLDLMKEWGFTHKQTYVWVKVKKSPLQGFFNNLKKSFKDIKDLKDVKKLLTTPYDINNTLAIGLGRLMRQTHEICLIGINNTKVYKKLQNKAQRSVSMAFNEKHSKKPEHLQDSLDLMFPNYPKIEIFARRDKKGWFCFGNECPMTKGEDIVDSIDKMINITDKEYDNLKTLVDESSQLYDAWDEVGKPNE